MQILAFRELSWHETPDGASLREAVRAEPHPDEGRVAAYLRGGVAFAVRPMVVGDFLRPEREMVSMSHWYTDGVWIWPTDLVYYVEEHHAELPREFLAYMASVGWAGPRLSREQIALVAEWFFARRTRETGPASAPDPAE